MKKPQRTKERMYGRMKLFLTKQENASVWEGFTRLEEEIVRFKALKTNLNKAIDSQGRNIKGVTKEKNKVRDTAIQLMVKYCSLAYVWAMDNDMGELVMMFDVKKTHFVPMSEAMIVSKLNNLRKVIAEHIGSMGSVGLSEDDLPALDTAILAFKNKLGTPRAERGRKKAAGTAIERLMGELDTCIGVIGNLLEGHYGESHPLLINLFKGTRKLMRMPTHHTGIVVQFKQSDGEDLEGVKLSLEGTKKVAVSNIVGKAEIIRVRGKEYWVVMEKLGFVSQRHKLLLKSGRILKIEVVMKSYV